MSAALELIRAPETPVHAGRAPALPSMGALRVAVAWSNAQASRVQLVRAALLRPTFERLLALALEPSPALGLAQLRREWRRLLRQEPEEARRAAPSVERILSNIAGGFRRARRQHYAQARHRKTLGAAAS